MIMSGRYSRYREKVLADWATDIGPEAAKIRWTSSNYQLYSWLFMAVGTITGIVAAYSHGSARTVLVWVCVGSLCVAGIGVIAMIYTYGNWKRASRRWREKG